MTNDERAAVCLLLAAAEASIRRIALLTPCQAGKDVEMDAIIERIGDEAAADRYRLRDAIETVRALVQ